MNASAQDWVRVVLPTWLLVCLLAFSICPSPCLSVSLSLCLHMAAYLLIGLCTWRPLASLFVCLNKDVSVCQSISVSPSVSDQAASVVQMACWLVICSGQNLQQSRMTLHSPYPWRLLFHHGCRHPFLQQSPFNFPRAVLHSACMKHVITVHISVRDSMANIVCRQASGFEHHLPRLKPTQT